MWLWDQARWVGGHSASDEDALLTFVGQAGDTRGHRSSLLRFTQERKQNYFKGSYHMTF